MRIMYTLAALGLVAMNVAAAADEQPPVPVPEAAAADEQPAVPVPDAPESAIPVPDAEPIALFYCVKVEDRDNIHPCAVPIIIAIVDPCNPCCCRYVEICVPPDCCPEISTRRKGTKVEYDYGEYEVDIYSKKDVIIVNYDD